MAGAKRIEGLPKAAELDERVARYLAAFGLEDEAARNRTAGIRSMRAARLPVVA